MYSGSLPNGLTLQSQGVISGTPTSSGTFDFTLQARNSYASTTKSFSITIYRNDDDDNEDVGKSSGGCDSGFAGLGLMLLAGFALKKSHR